MDDHNNIYIKVQIEKNKDSGGLSIRMFFDPNSPNFFQDEKGISWCPTKEEIDFINESFLLMPKYKSKDNQEIQKKEVDNENNNFESEHLIPSTEESDKVIVSADEKAIDNVLNRKKDDSNGFIVEASEETIIDKVLSRKKKGKW